MFNEGIWGRTTGRYVAVITLMFWVKIHVLSHLNLSFISVIKCSFATYTSSFIQAWASVINGKFKIYEYGDFAKTVSLHRVFAIQSSLKISMHRNKEQYKIYMFQCEET